MQVLASVCKSQQVLTSFCKFMQVFSNQCKSLQVDNYFCPRVSIVSYCIHLSLNECSRRGWQGASQISDPAKKTMPRLKTIIVNIICLLLLIIVCSVAAAHPCPFCLLVPTLESHKQSIMFPHHNKRLLIEIIHYYFLSLYIKLSSHLSTICLVHEVKSNHSNLQDSSTDFLVRYISSAVMYYFPCFLLLIVSYKKDS